MPVLKYMKKYSDYEKAELARRAAKKNKMQSYKSLARKAAIKSKIKLIRAKDLKFKKKNFIKAIGDPYK